MITLTPKQARVWRDILANPNIRRVFLDGGARATKTILNAAFSIHMAAGNEDRFGNARHQGLRCLIARKTRVSARKTLFDYTLPMIIDGRRGFVFKDSDMEIQCPNKGLIRVDGLDDADRVGSILGDEFGHIFLNEVKQLTWTTVGMVASRLTQSVPGLVKRTLLMDTNPGSTRSWAYKVGVMHVDPDTGQPLRDAEVWARQSFSPYDNPHLPPDALATLEALTGTQRRRLLEGIWCDNEGAVYDDFDEDIHVIDEMPKEWEKWTFCRGIDFGYTNPFVRLCGAIDPDGRLYIFREHYKARWIVSDHAKLIQGKDKENYDWTVADHDAEDRATLHSVGIFTTAAKKDVIRGVGLVKARLRIAGDGKPRLFFLRDCKNCIDEMIGYAWPPAIEGRSEKEAPVKENDHCPDVIRYMIAHLDMGSEGWGPCGVT